MKVLIYVSTHDKSESAVLFGGLFARATQAEVTLLAVITEGHTIDNAHEVFEEALDWIPDLDVLTSIRVGPEADCILKEINAGDYDLIAIGGSKSAANLMGWMMGDVTQEIVKQADCPVRVVRQKSSITKG